MKVGLCGLGSRLGTVVTCLANADKRFEFVAYADPGPLGLGKLEAAGIKTPKAYDRLEDMLEKEKLDLLMIGSPNHMHFDHIRLGLEAGLKIFTEKPVVINEAEVFGILELLRKYGADRVMVGLVLRYSELYRDLIKAKLEGNLGDIVSIEACEHLSADHGAFFMRDWRRMEKYSGGLMLEKCCHDLDLYQGVVAARPMRIASFGGRRIFTSERGGMEGSEIYHKKKSGWGAGDKMFGGDSDIADSQVSIVEYANGADLCFHINIHAPEALRSFRVFGTEGMAEGDFERNFFRTQRIHGGEAAKEKKYTTGGIGGHYGADILMARDIAKHLFDGVELPVSVADALESGLTAMKMDESRKAGAVISMEEIWKKFDFLLHGPNAAHTKNKAVT